MSDLLQACPEGRSSRRRLGRGPLALLAVALVVVVLPMAAPAQARKAPTHHPRHAHHAVRAHRHVRTPTHHAVVVPGLPPRNYVVPPGAYFSYPNRSAAESLAIRNRVLLTIRSTWGGPRNHLGYPMPTNGTIRIATWSFDDWPIARALVAAQRRGVSVQVMAAKDANSDHASWRWLRKKLGGQLYRPGYPITATTASFARSCRGACRGLYGTPHAKYFLFDNVGYRHLHDVVVQTSMNLTNMAYTGQWNQAQVIHSRQVYDDFLGIYDQVRLARPVRLPYHVAAFGNVVDFFFPRPGATMAGDPVIQLLDQVNCSGATVGGTGSRTKIRIIQYAIYGDRGVWIAKKLRYLWDRGCDVAIIYSVSSRPVLGILRNTSGRGPIPMKQSVVKDSWGNIVKYNHSKWMTITGHWGPSTAAALTFAGSANWANLAFGDDEQMQRIVSRSAAAAYLATFTKTWRQKSSQAPGYGHLSAFGREGAGMHLDVPAEAPEFGSGVFRYMTED